MLNLFTKLGVKRVYSSRKNSHMCNILGEIKQILNDSQVYRVASGPGPTLNLGFREMFSVKYSTKAS